MRIELKIQPITIATIASIVCLYPPLLLSKALSTSDECSAPAIIKNVKQTAASIKDYELTSRVMLDGDEVLSQISGRPPNLMRISMSVSQGNNTLVYSSIFDGNYQWIETQYPSMVPSVVEVSKIKLEGLIKPGRPFDTSYFIMGSGLLSGEDYPSTASILSTVYEFTARCTEGKYVLQGALNLDNFAKYNKTKLLPQGDQQIKKYAEKFGKINLVVDTKTFLVQQYSMGSKDKPKFFSAVFENLLVNRNLKITHFSYSPPKGKHVIDITNDILDRIKNPQ